MAIRRIDMHTHYFPRVLVDALRRREHAPRVWDEGGKTMIEYGPEVAYPLEPLLGDIDAKLAMMDEHGISHSVLSVNVPGVDWFAQRDAASLAREVNDELLSVIERDPERLSGLAALPMQAPDAAVEELQRATEAGLNGAQLYSNVAGNHLDDRALRGVFDAAAELDVALLLHPAYPLSAPTMGSPGIITGLGFLVDTSTSVLRLIFDGLYERQPDLKLVLPHVGSLLPYIVGRLDYQTAMFLRDGQEATLPGEYVRLLYVDTVCAWPPALRLALDYFGPERVMFGTDHPFWEAKPALDSVAELGLADDELQAIEQDTASALFGLG